MKKSLCIFVLLVMTLCAGCQPTSNSRIVKEIDGVSMVSAKDMSDLLGLNCMVDNDNIIFKQDNITLEINPASPYVYKDEYIMYILERPAAYIDGRAYVPLSFFTDYLKAEVSIDENDEFHVTNNDISLYSAVKFLPAEVLSAINDEDYPYRDRILKAVELPRSVGVEVPRIDTEKIIDTRPLEHYAKQDLKEHGYTMHEIVNFAYEDYNTIKNTWKITEEQINYAKKLYPDLENRDISGWTNEDYKDYYTAPDDKLFTQEEKERLEQKGILSQDMALVYEFTSGDISPYLDESEESLKQIISSQYNNIMDQIAFLAENYPEKKYEKVQPENRLATEEIDGMPMVPAQDIGRLLKIDYHMDEKDNIIFQEDNITIKLSFGSPYVYKDEYILYVMEAKPVKKNNIAYIPLEFLTDYLKVHLKSDKNHQLYVMNNRDFSLYGIAKFLPEEVLGAIYDKNYPYGDKILKAVELSRSMGIEIPNINGEKVIQTTPLDSFEYNFKQDLIKHGYTDKEIANFTIGDFGTIESTWELPEEMIGSKKRLYPELRHEDLSNWTYGDIQNYSAYREKMNLGSQFTEEQREEFRQRGILLEDVFYLRKDFYTVDTILAQSDGLLKETIEGYYQFAIDMLK